MSESRPEINAVGEVAGEVAGGAAGKRARETGWDARSLGALGVRGQQSDLAAARGVAKSMGAAFTLFDVAVAERGRLWARAPLVDDVLTSGWERDSYSNSYSNSDSSEPACLPLISHAGPSFAAWSSERALGPCDVETGFAQRRTQALNDEEWEQVVTQFAQSARSLAPLAPLAVVNAESDSLLGATLSPLYARDLSPAERLARFTQVVEAVIARLPLLGLLLVVEEGAPGGIDATLGIEAARAAVARGVSFIIADSRSAWFEVRNGESCLEQYLESAAFLALRVDVPIYAQVPIAATEAGGPGAALEHAKALGLHGVLVKGD